MWRVLGGGEGSSSSLDVWRSQAWVLRRPQMLTWCHASHSSLSEIVMMPSTVVLEGTGPGTNDPETGASPSVIIKCTFPLYLPSTNKGVFFQSAGVCVLQDMGWRLSSLGWDLAYLWSPFSISFPQSHTGSVLDSFRSVLAHWCF